MAIFSFIHLGVKNAGVKTGLARTKQDIGRFASDLKRQVAGIALGGGFLATVRQASVEFDKVAKSASKLGVSGEFIQRLSHASEKAGLSADTAQMAMQRFTRRMAEAKEGTGEALKAVQELGIQFYDQQGNLKTNEQLFREVADALANVSGSGDRLRLAFKFFDSEGVGLVNAFAEGWKSVEDATKDLNIVSNDDLKNIAAAKDAITDIKTNIITIVGSGLGKVVGYFRDIDDAITKRQAEKDAAAGEASLLNQAQRDLQEYDDIQSREEALAARILQARARVDAAKAEAENRGGFIDSIFGKKDEAEAALARAEFELDAIQKLAVRAAAGKDTPAVSELTRKEQIEKERLAELERQAQGAGPVGSALFAAGLAAAGLDKLKEEHASRLADEKAVNEEIAKLRADAARAALEGEEKILAIGRRQFDLRAGFAEMDADARKDAAREIADLEREMIAEEEAAREKRAQTAEDVLRLEKEAKNLRFQGGVDQVRNIGGTLAGTTLRLEAPKEAKEELKVAKDQLARLDAIIAKIPEEINIGGAEFRGGAAI